ncbi:MAG: hypothetical protein EPN97_03185 [Alphaproteobacteria bacterium]|nr:MAG: hypothetical protein EPN97_03185 [Alphaproteobacteria bacterium]
MSPKRDVSHIFNKFAGREVPMKEEPFVIRGKTYTQVRLANDDDPTVGELEQEAKKNGLKLRLWWPGVAGTADFRMDRVNAHIEKGKDGKYRIGNRFDLG